MRIQPAHIAVPFSLLMTAMVCTAWAQEPNKQPPLEMPKTLGQLDASKSGQPVAVVEEKEKPKVVAKKAKPASTDTPADPPKDLAGLPEMGNYKVKAGDTLDRVIQKFYASTPLRTDVLREALVQNNPQAFVKGQPKTLLAGANLQLPDPAELIKKLMPALVVAEAPNAAPPTSSVPSKAMPVEPVAPANAPPQGGAAAHQAGHNPGPDLNKRNWVRYP